MGHTRSRAFSLSSFFRRTGRWCFALVAAAGSTACATLPQTSSIAAPHYHTPAPVLDVMPDPVAEPISQPILTASAIERLPSVRTREVETVLAGVQVSSADQRAVRSEGLAAQLKTRTLDQTQKTIGVSIGVPLAAALGRETNGEPKKISFAPMEATESGPGPLALSIYEKEAGGVLRVGPSERPLLVGLDRRGITDDEMDVAIDVVANDLVWANAGGGGFDVTLVPRASLKVDSVRTSARAGAEVRVSPSLTPRQSVDPNAPRWYLYAGADGEAIKVDVAQARNLASFTNLRREDTLVSGDMVAGVAYERGGSHYGLAYMRREYSQKEFSFEEDYIGATVTRRW